MVDSPKIMAMSNLTTSHSAWERIRRKKLAILDMSHLPSHPPVRQVIHLCVKVYGSCGQVFTGHDKAPTELILVF